MPNSPQTARAELQEWQRFIRGDSHVLKEAPQLLFQQSFNSASDSAPARTAAKRFADGRETRLWLRRVNKREGRSPCLLTLTGQHERINFCGFASDGTTLVTTSYPISGDGTLRLSDATSGLELASLKLGWCPGGPMPCAISPGKLRIILTYHHRWWKDTKVFDLVNGRELFSVYAREEPSPDAVTIHLGIGPPEGETYWNTSAVAFSDDGGLMVAVGYWYGKWIEYIRIFDTSNWNEIANFEGPKVEIPYETDRVIFSPGSDCLALGSAKSIRILRVADGTEIATLPVEGLMKFTLDGRLLVAYGDTRTWDSEKEPFVVTIRLWDTKSWTDLETLKLRIGQARVGGISPDARRIALTTGNTVKICDLVPNAEALTLGEHGQDVSCCAFSEDGERLVSGASEVKLWDASVKESGENAPHTEMVNTCAFSPDGSLLATSSDDNTAKIWSADGRPVAKMQHNFGVQWAGFSPDGSKLLTRSELRLLMLWDAKTGNEIARMGPHCYHPLSCAYSPDGSRIVSGTGLGGVGELWLWNGENGEFILSFDGHTSWINHCLFTSDSKRVLSVSDDGTMRLWNATTGKQIALLLSENAHLNPWALSPNGNRVAAGMENGSTRLWNGKTGKLIATLVGQGGSISACAFSPDGKLLATGNRRAYASIERLELCVKLWDADTGAELATFAVSEHSDEAWPKIDACVFSPNSKLLFGEPASSHLTSEIICWDILTQSEVTRIRGDGGIHGFSPNGSLVVVGRKTLRIWDVQSLNEVACYLSTGARSVAWHPESALLAVGELSGDLHVLRIETHGAPLPGPKTSLKPQRPRKPRAPRVKPERTEAAAEAQSVPASVKRQRKVPSPDEVVVQTAAQVERGSSSAVLIVDQAPASTEAQTPSGAKALSVKRSELRRFWWADAIRIGFAAVLGWGMYRLVVWSPWLFAIAVPAWMLCLLILVGIFGKWAKCPACHGHSIVLPFHRQFSCNKCTRPVRIT